MKMKSRYTLNKSAGVGANLFCPSCGTPFTKESYQQAFCKSKGGTEYWVQTDAGLLRLTKKSAFEWLGHQMNLVSSPVWYGTFSEVYKTFVIHPGALPEDIEGILIQDGYKKVMPEGVKLETL